MTPFKFGKKKNHSKEAAAQDTSPSSKRTNSANSASRDSPQTSVTSNGSFRRDQRSPSLKQVLPPQSLPPQLQQQHQAQQQQGSGPVGFDHNNNIYTSPQRTPKQYGYGQSIAQQQQQGVPPTYAHNSHQQQIRTPWSRTKLLISPFPRYRHAASQYANDKGEVFVMGGLHNTSVYGDTWIIKPDGDGRNFQTTQVDIYDNSPAPRVGHASTTCGNAFVVFGGDTVTNDDGDIDNDLYLFNMNSHTWTIPRPIGKKPSGRYGHTIGVIAIMNFDSKVYLYGGQLDDTIYNDLIVFNLSSFRRPDVQWEWIKPADNVRPPPLTNHTMDVYDNSLWLFGGSTGQKLVNDLWTYDPMTNKWDNPKTFGSAPPPMEEHASVVFKDCLIVHGGKNVHGEAVSDVFFFNFITKTWFKMPSNYALNPQGKYGHTLSITKGNMLLILGGQAPDYARLGDNLEPSEEDNGVGTILNLLDLSNLERLVPGLQHYSTPGNISNQEKFNGPQSIFTPPAVGAKTNVSPQNERYNSTSPTREKLNDERQPFTPNVPPPRSPGHYGPTGATIIGGDNAGVAPVIGAGISHTTSAEDVFNREREALVQTPERKRSHSSQHSASQTKFFAVEPSEFEKDLPLEIPAPVKELQPEVPAPITQTVGLHEKSKTLSTPLPGTLERPALPVSVDRFKTQSTYDDKVEDDKTPLNLYTSGVNGRSSDILDSYVNGSPSRSSLREPIEAVNEQGTGAVVAIGAAAAGAVGAVGAVLGSVVGSSKTAPVSDRDVSVSKGAIVPATIPTPTSHTDTAVSFNGMQQFKDVIDSMSKELENLKLSTTEQVKSASEKVNELEAENAKLREQLSEISKKEPEGDDEDENSFKRKYITMNTDYQLLLQENAQMKSRSSEVDSIFTKNLIDLQSLNNLIQQQQEKLETQQTELEQLKTMTSEHEDLKRRIELLETENSGLKETSSKALGDSHLEIQKLNIGLDAFLAQYLSRDESTGEYVSKSLSEPDDSETSSKLKTQIEQLLAENEQILSSKARLEEEVKQNTHKSVSEVEVLKEKVLNLTRIEDNYKESLHSVNTANRALKISQSELSREKELNNKLQHEIDELKLYRSKKASRNATPIINDYDKKGANGAEGSLDDDDDDDVANAHYNLKIRDLQAELYITQKERDDLKEEAMTLKKKLYNAANPSGSF